MRLLSCRFLPGSILSSAFSAAALIYVNNKCQGLRTKTLLFGPLKDYAAPG